MSEIRKAYLGDGLYVSDDVYMLVLRAPREDGEHWVGLEPEVLDALLRFIESSRGVKITIENLKHPPNEKGRASE